jgi:hypothetical protein
VTINSNASAQPSQYAINLLIDDSTLDEALLAAVAAEGSAEVHILKTAGTFGSISTP